MSEPNKTSVEGEENPVVEGEDSGLSLKGGGLALPSMGWAKGTQGFLSEVRTEFKKITWPSRQQVLTETGVVILVVTFLTLLILAFDWIFSLLSNRFLV
ncbi:MAG TPA: preprotein translocase subunit SecE [Stenomitos sp.]